MGMEKMRKIEPTPSILRAVAFAKRLHAELQSFEFVDDGIDVKRENVAGKEFEGTKDGIADTKQT